MYYLNNQIVVMQSHHFYTWHLPKQSALAATLIVDATNIIN